MKFEDFLQKNKQLMPGVNHDPPSPAFLQIARLYNSLAILGLIDTDELVTWPQNPNQMAENFIMARNIFKDPDEKSNGVQPNGSPPPPPRDKTDEKIPVGAGAGKENSGKSTKEKSKKE